MRLPRRRASDFRISDVQEGFVYQPEPCGYLKHLPGPTPTWTREPMCSLGSVIDHTGWLGASLLSLFADEADKAQIK